MSLLVGASLERLERGEAAPEGVSAGYPFSHVRDRLREEDLAIGNLECVVSPKGALSPSPSPLRAPLFTIRVLKEAGFDAVTIANNHSSDYGEAAFDDMARRLTAEGLPFVGGGSFDAGPEEPLVLRVRGLRIGLLGFYERAIEGAASDVRKARQKVDVLVVYNHWGRESWAGPLPVQRQKGRALIDAGADLVVGSHSHVLSPEEWYKGKLIFYGLGNFVFSGMNIDEAHRTGGYLEVTVGPKGLMERQFYRVRLDDTGAPRWLDTEPREPPRTKESEPPNL